MGLQVMRVCVLPCSVGCVPFRDVFERGNISMKEKRRFLDEGRDGSLCYFSSFDVKR